MMKHYHHYTGRPISLLLIKCKIYVFVSRTVSGGGGGVVVVVDDVVVVVVVVYAVVSLRFRHS
jgi:hypothetical protein